MQNNARLTEGKNGEVIHEDSEEVMGKRRGKEGKG